MPASGSTSRLLRVIAEIASAAWTAFALASDLIWNEEGLRWSLLALIGFVFFAALIFWRLWDQHQRMTRLEGDQRFELVIRGLQEQAREIAASVADDPNPWSWRELVEAWTLDAEETLRSQNPALISRFRGGPPRKPMPADPLWEIKLLAEGPTRFEHGKLKSDVKRYVERRSQRLGDILFSMPNPRSKGMMLG